MKMSIPRFTDVRGIARDLENDPRYAKLGRAIRKAALAQACISDLAQALTCCTALDSLLISPRKKGTLERSVTENALLMNAVMLYARATSSNGGRGERGSVSILSRLDSDQLADHEAIVETRNRALAHVYSRELVADDIWHQDQLFLVETEDGWKPGSATKTFQFHRPTLDRLSRQLPLASEIITSIFHKHMNSLIELFTSSPVPMALFEVNLFDPVEFFGSERGVAAALAGMPSGSSVGIA